jgi:hypothetical protein
MWLLDNRTPFAVERTWVRGRDGCEITVVAVKATFDIHDDGSTGVAQEQPPVLILPEYHGEPGKSSLRHEADLILAKRTTDVLVLGRAYAPGANPVAQLDVGFRVGPVRKVLRVFGNRKWTASGMSAPEPFRTMALVYERAFGGVDARSGHPERDWEWRNPVGTGFAASSGAARGQQLPNIEYPENPIRNWSDRPAPAGFGPICAHWQPRASFAGTYDDGWRRTRQPLLPDDFDERFFQCAPADQQSPNFLNGGEPVTLLRLTPGGELHFSLPKIYLGFETRFYDGAREFHHYRKLHTVILEPDLRRVSMVWHSPLACHAKGGKLRETIVTLRADASTGVATTQGEALELA